MEECLAETTNHTGRKQFDIVKFSSMDLTAQGKAKTITKQHWQVSEPQMRCSI